jgi:hypothetical protein
MNKVDETEKCPECEDTGFYGDNGPGTEGNNEYVPCECDAVARFKRKNRKLKLQKVDTDV